MRKFNQLSLAAALLLLAACDPWGKVGGGATTVMAVTGTNGAADPKSGDPLPVNATETNGAWAASVCDVPDTAQSIHVTFNHQINGDNIQTTVDDCTPANGWLKADATPAIPAGSMFYTCYSPSGPSPDWGGSVVIYLAPAAAPTATPPVAPSSGWADAVNLPAGTYHFTGNADGNPIDVTITATGACP